MIAFPAPPISQANFSNDQIITLQPIVNNNDGTFGFPPNFVWQIDNTQYTNIDGDEFLIEPASEGYFRTDIAYLDNTSVIKFQQGIESDTAPQTPIVPENAILLCTWNIFGSDITEPAIMPDNSSFVRKSFSSEINIAGSPTFLVLDSPNGSTAFNFISNNTSNDFCGFKTNTGYLYSYDGKIFCIKNNGLNPITIQHGITDFGINIPFNFKDGLAQQIKSKELKYFRFSVLRGLEPTENNFGQNTSIGNMSSSYVDTDSMQTNFGYYAGYNTLSSNNTCIGTYTGSGSTGVRCIHIGYMSGINNTGNDVISLGYLDANNFSNVIVFNTTETQPDIIDSNSYVFKVNDYTLNIKAVDRNTQLMLPKNDMSKLASDLVSILDSAYDPATITEADLNAAYPDAEDGLILGIYEPLATNTVHLIRYFGLDNKWKKLGQTFKDIP